MYYVGRVVCAPCNARCWGALCAGCGKCCEECVTCGGCCCPENRPSPLFLGFTLLMNAVPAVIFTVLGLLNIHNHCDTYVPAFFYGTAVINLFFVAFAIHIYTFFSRPYDARREADKGPMARACHVFWNDPWVASFVLFFIAGFAWAIAGFDAFASAQCGDHSVKGHYLPKAASICAAILLVYILTSLFMIVLSLLLEFFRRAPLSSNPPPNGRPISTPQTIIGRLFFPQQRPQMNQPAPPGYNSGYPQTAPPAPITDMVRPAPPPGYAFPPNQRHPPVQPVQMGYPVQSTPSVKPGFEGSRPGQSISSPAYASPQPPYGSPPPPYGSQPPSYGSPPPGYVSYSPTSTHGGPGPVVAAPPPPGYVPYDQVHGPFGRELGAVDASGNVPPEPTAADKAFALGKRFAGNVGTGLKKLGAFVEEKAGGHGTSASGSAQSSSALKR